MTPGVDAQGEAELDAGRLELAVTATPGQVVGLVGPNGAGKSATLAVLVGLLPLVSGSIRIGGRLVDDGRTRLPPHRRSIGWVQQRPALLPRRRVLDQVAAFSRADAPFGDRPRERLAELGLDPDDPRRPGRLSGGEIQRVAVARALSSSAVALLDEPLSAQDGAGANAIRAALRRYASAGGTVVVVAHRPEDAYLLADRLVVLQERRVIQTGTPADLAAQPSSPYVARVVGATVLEGEVDEEGYLNGAWGRLAVPDGTGTGPAVAIVRPATVTLHAHRPEDTSARNIIEGHVDGLSDTAAGVLVRVVGPPDLVAALTRTAVAELGLVTGRKVWATVKASEVLVTTDR